MTILVYAAVAANLTCAVWSYLHVRRARAHAWTTSQIALRYINAVRDAYTVADRYGAEIRANPDATIHTKDARDRLLAALNTHLGGDMRPVR